MTTLTDRPREATLNCDTRRNGQRQTVRIVTTSWDDGDPLDLQIAGLLSAHRLQGTFYIPIKGHHNLVPMNQAELRAVAAQGFEIGAHGVSHPNLTDCEPRELAQEVESSKKFLEDCLGAEVRAFAYPRGRYNASVISSLKRAGYVGARTTRMLAHQLTFDPFRMPTSAQVFPHSQLDYLRNIARSFYLEGSWEHSTLLRLRRTWTDLAKGLFDAVMQTGGIWHLYGHSWEIEAQGLWNSLKTVLDYVSNREGVLYLTNSQALDHLPAKSPNLSPHNH